MKWSETNKELDRSNNGELALFRYDYHEDVKEGRKDQPLCSEGQKLATLQSSGLLIREILEHKTSIR